MNTTNERTVHMTPKETIQGYTAPQPGEVCVHYDAYDITNIYDADSFDETLVEPMTTATGEIDQPIVMRHEEPAMIFMKPCGECGLCCLLLAVDELGKPARKWCEHFKPGTGCAKVDDADRPASCEAFDCLWRQDVDSVLPANLRPDRCNVMLAKALNSHGVVAYVHPKHPSAYRDNKVWPLLQALRKAGSEVFVVAGDKRMKVE